MNWFDSSEQYKQENLPLWKKNYFKAINTAVFFCLTMCVKMCWLKEFISCFLRQFFDDTFLTLYPLIANPLFSFGSEMESGENSSGIKEIHSLSPSLPISLDFSLQ